MLNIISIIINSYIPHLGNSNKEFSNKYVFRYGALRFKNINRIAYNWRSENYMQYVYNFIYTLNGDYMLSKYHMLPFCLRIK